MRPDHAAATQRLPVRTPAVHAPGTRRFLYARFIAATVWIGRQLERRRGRLALLEMTDEQLKDIGISRCDAHREGIKAFWE